MHILTQCKILYTQPTIYQTTAAIASSHLTLFHHQMALEIFPPEARALTCLPWGTDYSRDLIIHAPYPPTVLWAARVIPDRSISDITDLSQGLKWYKSCDHLLRWFLNDNQYISIKTVVLH